MTDPHTGPTPVQRHSPKVIGAIYGLFRNLEVHDEHNQLFEQLTLEILHALVAFESNVGETFTLQTYGQEAVVCSRLLRLDDTNFERTTMLGKLLVRAGIGGLMLGGSTSKENVEHFSRDLRQALKGDTTALQRGAYGEILFATLEEDPSALHATRPEQLALWLFATLLDLICTLAQARDEGQRPSLLPLKRVLQRISEAARKHGAVFQLLPAVRDYKTQLTIPHRAAVEALVGLGFGIRLGLNRAELLSIAVAAILCRIGDQEEELVSEVLSYQGLGELGPTVLLAAHDLVHPSEESGLVGQLLSLVRTYEDALGPDEGALPHAEAIERTLASPPAGVEAPLASMFAAWQGKQPLGSLLELDEGQVALVFGPSEHVAGSSRVASLEESGELGPLVDLGDSSAPSVRQAVSPVRLELDLTQLRSGS